MSEHTPGPWKVVDPKGAGLQIHANPGKRDFGVYKWDGEKPLMIFTLRRESPHIGIADERWMQFPADEWDAMQKANAQLIARAPDLLAENAALRAQVERLEGEKLRLREASTEFVQAQAAYSTFFNEITQKGVEWSMTKRDRLWRELQDAHAQLAAVLRETDVDTETGRK